jgi:drug/metabolite transporter (DMT)-like permease
MSLHSLLLIIVSVSLSALAQLALKSGVMRAGGAASGLLAMVGSPWVIAGLGLYALSTLIWLSVLARAPLSLAYPFVGLGFVATMLLGALVLGESVTPIRIAGTLLIAFGCVLVARSA